MTTRPRRHAAALLAALAISACGGDVDHDGAGGAAGSGGAGGAGGVAGAEGGAAGGVVDAGTTPCSAPDWEGCGVPECPEGRPGCSFCLPADELGLIGICAESLADELGAMPADGTILLTTKASFVTPPLVLNQVPFSAGLIVASYGQEARLGYADRGKWTGKPIPQPTECPKLANVPTCGGYCGGCPVGEICTGRAPLHPYGLCIPKSAGVCSLVPEVNGSECKLNERCFVFTVEPEHQFAANAKGFCLPQAVCEATAANLPGGGSCK
jgi:hypothetical protein